MITPTSRNVHLVYKEDDKSTARNLKAVIKIVGSLPFVSATQKTTGNDPEDTNSETVEYTQALHTVRLGTATDDDFINIPYDIDMPDRFTMVAVMSSIGTMHNSYLVHDAKYGDLLLLPNLRTLGNTDTSKDYLTGVTLELECWKVGVFATGRELVTPKMSPEERTVTLPVPLKRPFVSSHLFATYQANGGSNNNNFGYDIKYGYLENNAVGTTELCSVGDNTSLFGVKVPAYRMISATMKHNSYINIGLQDLDDVLIPLPY